MKKRNPAKEAYVTCRNMKGHPKTYQVENDRKKPGFAICPACGEYHPLNKE